MKLYTCSAVDKLIDIYINEYNGELIQLKEGTLGHGQLILTNAKGKKSVVVNEVYISAWSSGHTIRKYNKLPSKYLELINNI